MATKAESKSAFLKTSNAIREAYVKPPSERKMLYSRLWKILTVVYTLLQFNTIGQIMLDQVLLYFLFYRCQNILGLFQFQERRRFVSIVAE